MASVAATHAKKAATEFDDEMEIGTASVSNAAHSTGGADMLNNETMKAMWKAIQAVETTRWGAAEASNIADEASKSAAVAAGTADSVMTLSESAAAAAKKAMQQARMAKAAVETARTNAEEESKKSADNHTEADNSANGVAATEAVNRPQNTAARSQRDNAQQDKSHRDDAQQVKSQRDNGRADGTSRPPWVRAPLLLALVVLASLAVC
ncbi:hypothetical protein DQ04_24461000 [Trypanosoma grayi]|uniref:hypothetical protein n=1 Tax=Trypanosoma grayi TaxID=71804 RepID=UPI0004F42480|nr:hypothetical protein DQ04_24461000 [Trypanosoma grayi]KEG05261.1 hypothetical protein DQ04_24461000 [Trypanosoma grayi]